MKNDKDRLVYVGIALLFVVTLLHDWNTRNFSALLAPVVGLSLTLAITAYLLAQFRHDKPALMTEREARQSQILTVSVFLLLPLIFILNALWRQELFPLLLVGESNHAINHSRGIIFGMNQKSWAFLRHYNIGLGLLHAPLRQIAGESLFSLKMLTISLWAVMVMLLAGLFCRHYRVRWPMLIMFAPAMVSGITLAALRRYKWHPAALVASVAVYYCMGSLQQAQRFRGSRLMRGVAGTLLLILAVFMYHGTIMYVPVICVMLVIDLLVSPQKKARPPKQRALAMLLVLFIAGTIWIVRHPKVSLFVERLSFEVFTDPRPQFQTLATFITSTHSFFRLFFKEGMSIPMSVIFILGLASGIRRFRTDDFARTTMSLFTIMLGLLLMTYDLFNFDEICYIIIPFIGVILLGLQEIGSVLSALVDAPRVRCSLLLSLSLFITLFEARNYYSKQLYNYIEQFEVIGSLMLRDVREKLLISPKPDIFFPGVEVGNNEGGLPEKNFYVVNKENPDFYPEFQAVRFFSSIETLRQDLAALIVPERDRPILIYYVNPIPQPLEELLNDLTARGIAVQRSVNTPYPHYWPKMTIQYISLRVDPVGTQ